MSVMGNGARSLGPPASVATILPSASVTTRLHSTLPWTVSAVTIQSLMKPLASATSSGDTCRPAPNVHAGQCDAEYRQNQPAGTSADAHERPSGRTMSQRYPEKKNPTVPSSSGTVGFNFPQGSRRVCQLSLDSTR